MSWFGALILAGGKATRMGGQDKSSLELCGQTFLNRFAGELAEFDEIILSVDRPGRLTLPGAKTVIDHKPGCGPLGGIVSALKTCRSDALLTVAVDMPLFTIGLGKHLITYCDEDCDAVVAIDRTGRLHPTCAVYKKSCLNYFKGQIARGQYRLIDVLQDRLSLRFAPLHHTIYDDSLLANINTPEEYAALRKKVRGPVVVAVSGRKNSGKTTLLRGIIPLLVKQGVRVGFIKHDGHDFVPDVPGTDSAMLREAGAERVAVYSAKRFLLTSTWEDGGLADLLPRFADVDVVLVEGLKDSTLPKIEVLGRRAMRPACDPATLLAVVGDANPALPGVRFFRRDDCHGAAEIIMNFLNEGGACATDSTGS